MQAWLARYGRRAQYLAVMPRIFPVLYEELQSLVHPDIAPPLPQDTEGSMSDTVARERPPSRQLSHHAARASRAS